MAYLLILTGGRVDELFELNPTATLTVGTSPTAHLQLPDAELADIHCQVYPAEGHFWLQDLGQGRTLHNTRQLRNDVSGLAPHDVLVFGDTFLKFVTERPTTAEGDDPNAEEIQRLSLQLSASQADVSAAEMVTASVRDALNAREQELAEARQTTDALRRDAERRQVESDARRTEAERELSEARDQVQQAAGELERTGGGVLVFQRPAEANEIRAELRALRLRATRLRATGLTLDRANTSEAAGET